MLKLELRTLGLTAIIVSSLLLQACGQSEQAPKQKVSDFLKSMFEEPNQTLAEQIAYYEAKETK